jgi:predicted dehydrogenase
VTRFGLVGTGYWADVCHAAGLAAHSDPELVAVWGRDPEKARVLAERYGVDAETDLDALLETVDAVAFSVPPDVQAELAVRAARAGCHLLLEKPVALSVEAAERVVEAVEDAAVASVVFFTQRFVEPVDEWLRLVAESEWEGGSGAFLTTSLGPDSPFSHSPWRREHGGLWDLAPHLLALLVAALGPVEEVTALRGRGDATHVVLRHEGGPSSAITVSATAPPAAERLRLELWGPSGFSEAPLTNADVRPPYARAISALIDAIETGVPHACSARFGAEVVRVVEAADEATSVVVA